MISGFQTISFALGLVFLPGAVYAQQSPDSSLQVDSVVWQLNSSACESPDAQWQQISGPDSAVLNNSGRVRVSEYGEYGFEINCCSAGTVSNYDRIQSLLASPDRVGFGARATGGAAASHYTVVTNLNDSGAGSLRDALDQNTPRWIVFDESIHGGTIRLQTSINVHNGDVTIDGRGADITLVPNAQVPFSLLQFRGGNSIINGLTFDGNDTRFTALMIREGDYYWIDHITIKDFIYDDGIAIGQGSRGPTSASEVTISNYHVFNAQYAVLGGGNNSIVNYPPYRVTIHSSNLSARDRNPRIKNHGTAHVFNSYIHSFRFSGMNAGANSTVVSENNVFSAQIANNPKVTQSGTTTNGGSSGVVYTNGDVFLDVAQTSGSVQPISNLPFEIPYDYDLMDADQVIEHVTTHAGANGASSTAAACQTIEEKFRYSP